MKKTDDEIDLTGDLDFDDWKTVLALAKALQERAKLLEAQAKKHLEDDLLPNEPEQAFLNGTSLATISITKGGSTTKLAVTDSPAYVEWLQTHKHDDDVEYLPHVKDYALQPSFIEKLAEEHEGTLPDGTGMKTTSSRATVRVSLDKSMRDKPLDFASLPVLPLLGIEAPKTEATQPEEEDEDSKEGFPWEAN